MPSGGARAARRARARLRTAQSHLGRATAGLRVLPDALIIGAQRCGTTSLYKLLVDHPDVVAPPLGKGAHYFDVGFDRGERWYRGHFPTAIASGRTGPLRRRLTLEASPYYLFHPLVPGRVRELLPDVRLIAMLREPVARAWSQYHHEVARGYETVSFAEAIEQEPRRLAEDLERMRADPGFHGRHHQHHSYLARGRYAEQLERWYASVPREQVLVLSSERFFADPASSFAQVTEFLGLRPWDPGSYDARNSRSYDRMSVELQDRLREHFAEPNRRLAELTGLDFGWPA